jgi:2-(1,2-epoxy-1,2-dihydrophenyl)acetyl-CoA isomerase
MTVPDTSPVLLTREGGHVTLTFNRPVAMNALDLLTAHAFLAACTDLASDEAVLLLVHMNAPVIASVHGVVAGGSLSLAMACDLTIAAEGTRFNLAYANVGANCDVGGSWHLPRLVGLRNAMQIALLSDTFDATEALRLGLVNHVVPLDTLQDETLALASRLAVGPTLAYGRMKRLLRQSFETDLSSQLDAERENFKASTQTQDFKEALEAFFAKRRTVFTGQ